MSFLNAVNSHALDYAAVHGELATIQNGQRSVKNQRWQFLEDGNDLTLVTIKRVGGHGGDMVDEKDGGAHDAPDKVFRVSKAGLRACLERIDNMGATTKTITSDPLWLELHGWDKWNVMYDFGGQEPEKRFEYALPCNYCGIILPYRLFQVDHIWPAAGTSHESICKVFRALGLTVEGPSGTAGKGYRADNLLDDGPRIPKGHFFKNTPATGNKFTLNSPGVVVFNLIGMVDPGHDALLDRCKNSFLNFTPACPSCNRSKSDKRREVSNNGDDLL